MLSAQERALEAQQHGYRLTQNQKNLLDRLSPSARAAIKEKNTKVLNTNVLLCISYIYIKCALYFFNI